MSAEEDQEDYLPANFSCNSLVVDLDFHPSQNLIATGDIEGQCRLHSYGEGETTLKDTSSHHKKSVRSISFSKSGDHLLTVSKDKSMQVLDVDSNTVVRNFKKCHPSSLYSILAVEDNIVATGDEDGVIKLWDLRLQQAIMEVNECSDFISDMTINDYKRFLLATSGEGTLSCYDIRKHTMKMQSELMDSELLSIAIVKEGSKVVCGSGEGTLEFFNWGQWGNISDRYPGHPMSVDCMVTLNDDVLLTGSLDGVIRAVHMLPNKILGRVGTQPDLPIENLSLSHCGDYVASCTHDETIRFYATQKWADVSVDTSRKGRDAERAERSKTREESSFFSGFQVDIASGVVAPNSDEDEGEEDEEEEGGVGKIGEAGANSDREEEMSESSGCSVIDDVETDEISDLTESGSDSD